LVLDEGIRLAIVGAGGYGRLALDVLIASGFEAWIIGFYDDAHAVLPDKVRGFPVLGDIGVLKSMLSVEAVHVVVAITDNRARLRIANSIRALGAQFFTAVHPAAYVSAEAVVGDGSVVAAGAVVHPDTAVGSHCYLGPRAVVDRDAVVGAGTWVSAGAVVGTGARVGVRAVLGQNSSVGRRAIVGEDAEVAALSSVEGDCL
jgi:sugar O-acyltransferase (sialic acid O-acetyltransferase NeuD family)